MKSKRFLTFVNHASFYVSNDQTLLLVDPWVEGAVFNNGWSLLDPSTSNAALVRELADQRRTTYVWFSHEHPDRLSIPFLKRLRQDFAGPLTLLYQQTKDKRIVNLLRAEGFTVTECAPARPVRLDHELSITVWPHADGKSWSLIRCGERHILDLSDCAVASADSCRQLRARLPPGVQIDLLLTQFGYANWVGNPFEAEARRAAAAAKLQRIKLQIAAFAPSIVVPFASFAFFSHAENHYLNDGQNSAAIIARWAGRCHTTNCVRFLRPGGRIDLDGDTPGSLRAASDAAVAHWTRMAAQANELLPAEPPASIEQVQAAVARHRKAVRARLPLLPALLERTGLIHPLTIYVPDLALRLLVSYVQPCRTLPAEGGHDIAMTSPSVLFLFENEHGFNTTRVNGRFRTSDEGAIGRFARFFMPQPLWRQGYGIDHPAATLRYLCTTLIGRVQRALGSRQRRLVASRAKY